MMAYQFGRPKLVPAVPTREPFRVKQCQHVTAKSWPRICGEETESGKTYCKDCEAFLLTYCDRRQT